MKKDDLIKKLNYKFLDGIAHRGLHTETITENSIEAFKNALLQDVAIELDVHLSKDKVLIVCHDANLKRTTGKEGIIERLVLKELDSQALQYIELFKKSFKNGKPSRFIKDFLKNLML